jgi:hypothetical protein
MDSLEHQTRLIQKILDELLMLTPESWSSILYAVACAWDSDRLVTMSHEISSPEGHRDPVEPSPALIAATQELARVFHDTGLRWKGMRALAICDSSRWKLEVDHQYVD